MRTAQKIKAVIISGLLATGARMGYKMVKSPSGKNGRTTQPAAGSRETNHFLAKTWLRNHLGGTQRRKLPDIEERLTQAEIAIVGLTNRVDLLKETERQVEEQLLNVSE